LTQRTRVERLDEVRGVASPDEGRPHEGRAVDKPDVMRGEALTNLMRGEVLTNLL
jgi:hypothetical protein